MTDETFCDNASCVEVELGDPVLVWQTDQPEVKIQIPGWQWTRLLDRIVAGEHINWDGALFPLVFTGEEIDAFKARVKAGKHRVHAEAADVG